MKFASFALLLSLVFASHVAHAQIFNTTSAESDTGGNTSGSAVVIQGDASSRVEVRNTGGGNNAEVHIEIETKENGDVRKETLYERLEGRKNIELRLSTTTPGGSADVRVRIGEVSTTTSDLSNLFRVFQNAMPGGGNTVTSSARASVQAQIASDTEPGFFARLFATFRAFWGL